MSARETPLGLTIVDIEVNGEEFDSDSRRVDVDTFVHTNDKSLWLLNLITRDHYLQTELVNIYRSIDNPSLYLDTVNERKITPYVLNDKEITDDVLRSKFIGREVAQDLAAAMIFYSS